MPSKTFTKLLRYPKLHPTRIYPILLLGVFLILVLLRINGSSIGIYHSFLYGNGTKDANLIYGTPRPIRSDEWLVNTQMTIAQEENGYKRFNTNFYGQKDMSLVIDAPYVDWSTAFKPQNLSFFVLPFEYAFAFKWWFLLLSLLLSAYYLTLKILPNKVIYAVCVSVITGLSPFVFWWYQSSTILTLTYGFLIMILGMSIIEATPISLGRFKPYKKWSAAFKTLVLTYLLASFALILYPPFQIPIVLIVAFFLLGYLLNKGRGYLKKNWRIILVPFGLATILTIAISGAFVLTRSEVVQTISNTVYPGKRVIKSGGSDVKKLLTTYLQPLIQIDEKGVHYGMNQSESSNFILTPLYFIVPFISLFTWLYIKQKKFEWVLFCLILCNLLFLADLFLPNIDIIAKLSLLHLVPHDRMLIGTGILTIVTLVYSIKVYAATKIKMTRNVILSISVYLLALFVAMIFAGLATSQEYPLFISSRLLIGLLALCVIAGVSLLLFKKFTLGLILIAVFSVASIVTIHPLYKGLGPIYKSEVSQAIQKLSNDGDTWAAAENIVIENIPQISGRPAVTGVSAYPNNSFWKQFSEMKDDTVYNRYAHIVMTSDDSSPIKLVGADNFVVSEGCGRKISEEVDYIVSAAPINNACERLIKTLTYPNMTFYFYKG